MSTLLQAIGEVLRPEVLCSGTIVLREDDPGSSCRPVTLRRNGPAVVLKADNPEAAGAGRSVGDWLFPLFRTNEPGIACMCDYIVFYQQPRPPGHLFVFLCELKSGVPGGALRQVANGRVLADHVIAMARHHRDVYEAPRIAYRGLIFSTNMKAAKGTMKPTSPPYRPAPRMPEITFAHFACGTTHHLELLCD